VKVRPEDRCRLEAIIGDRNAPQKQSPRADAEAVVLDLAQPHIANRRGAALWSEDMAHAALPANQPICYRDGVSFDRFRRQRSIGRAIGASGRAQKRAERACQERPMKAGADNRSVAPA
jgi:hypothetical protein